MLAVGFASGYLEPPIQFAIKHPEVLLYSGMLSLCSMGGQFFITHTIKEFGALAFSAIMTTRLFLSILLSCLLYVHYLTPLQWLCTGVVFGALYYKVSVGAHSSQAEKPRP
jgi:adenosine 3'-phospho 5'-phosphosulfate transporter B2